ncbi:MAG: hypothetical protein ACLFU2_09435 [Opitutales bacterium]
METAQTDPQSAAIIDWYWEHGHQRTGKYTLRSADWLDRLYAIEKSRRTLRCAEAVKRPSAAVWGPSQTGKSTSVSRYIDANVQIAGDPATDGSEGGLHWPGGRPAYFLFPYACKESFHPDSIVLNPFNSGLDASACLSRFTLGSREKGGRRFHFPDPRYPVRVQLVKPIDLWMSVARGYDSQCLGPVRGGERRPPTVWTRDRLERVLDKHATAPVPREQPVSRAAYEHLHDFCDLVEDLIFAGLPRFRELGGEEGGWTSFRYYILGEAHREGPRNALLASLENAEAFTAEVLWDSFAVLTRYFKEMSARLAELTDGWGDQPVFCSLEVASLFLDMETMLNYLKPRPTTLAAGDEKQRKIAMAHRVVPQVGWKEHDGCVFVGAEERFHRKLFTTPESFGVLQGLVWELTVPLNPDHLEDTPFKGFLEVADYLDFPGVERGASTSEESKIDLEVMTEMRRREQTLPPDDAGEGALRSCPLRFFTSILKRGKTSSIVQTYAKQLTIDAFNIFQDMDGDKPNGDQLITGVRSWWRSCAPAYYASRTGPSPLPLNLVLLWWAKFINEGHTLQDRQVVWKALGEIADPEIATTFTMNYYGIRPRGHLFAEKAEELPRIVERIKSESAFRKQFRQAVSRASFDAMVRDRETGGTDFFFTQLRKQLESGSAENRALLLEDKRHEALQAFRELLAHPDLIPHPRPKDTRQEQLEAFRERFLERLAGKREDVVRRMNWTLRMVLNVNATDLYPVGRAPGSLKIEDVREQFERWSSQQLERHREWTTAADGPDLALIGLGALDDYRAFLEAMVQSMEADLPEITAWLRKLLQYLSNLGDSSTDVRRFLAIRMGNALIYGPRGPTVALSDPAEEWDLEDTEGPAREPVGEECLAYRSFLEPFLGPEGHLGYLAQRQIRAILRPEQPGDGSIVELARASGLVPELVAGQEGDPA